jgi:hypothetical protein
MKVRYQAAIFRKHHVLMLMGWVHAFSGKTFLVIPCGGRHANESEEDRVKREAVEDCSGLFARKLMEVKTPPPLGESLRGLMDGIFSHHDFMSLQICNSWGLK